MNTKLKLKQTHTSDLRDQNDIPVASQLIEIGGLSRLTVAARFTWLFEHVVDPATGKRFTLSAVRDQLRERGVQVSVNTIRNVRRGSVTHPSWHVIEGLACVFQMPLAFFSIDVSLVELGEQVAALALLKNSPYWTLAQRLSRLSPAGRAATLQITAVAMEQIEALETDKRPSHDATPHR